MGLEAGLTDDVIDGIRRGEAADELDRAVLNAVDELEDNRTSPMRRGRRCRNCWRERQRMDLVFTIGCYGALAMAINTFGVEPDQER